jgi:phage terminase large subunit-like protein
MGSTELNNLRDTLSILTELNRRWEQRRFFRLFPEEDTVQPDGTVIHAREKYAKHLEFFAAGATYRERCFMAGNRVGKTYSAGGYEVSCHLTGLYPEWWTGRRFKRPVRAWAAGKTNETTRDIVQRTLLGDPLTVGGRKRFDGTGVVPGHLIGGVTWKQGVPDLADTVRIRHLPTGGYSVLGIKSYQQGRGSFEGTAQEVIWFDEEPPQDVYGESLIRTATTNGIILLTFTPLEGLSEVVLSFLPENMRPADPDAVSEVYE